MAAQCALPIRVVRCVITSEPTLEGRLRICLVILGDLIGVGSIERELENQAVGVFDVDRAAIPVFQHKGVGILIARRLDTLLDRLLCPFVDLEPM